MADRLRVGHRVTVTIDGRQHPGTIAHTWTTRILRRRWYVVHVDHLGDITVPARDVQPIGGAR